METTMALTVDTKDSETRRTYTGPLTTNGEQPQLYLARLVNFDAVPRVSARYRTTILFSRKVRSR